MADNKNGLPVRTEEDVDKKVQVKIVDSQNPDAQQATVDTDGNLHTEVHGNDPSGADQTLRTSEQGHASVDGVYDAVNNTDPSNIGLVAQERNATSDDIRQNQRVTAIRGTDDESDRVSLDVAIHDANGNKIDDANPLPVTFTENPGTDIHDFFENVDVAENASADHTYVVPAGNDFLLHQILLAASGRARYEILVGATGLEATRAVAFTSVANPNFCLTFKESIDVPAGQNVIVRKTNIDCDAQSIYSTISGTIRA